LRAELLGIAVPTIGDGGTMRKPMLTSFLHLLEGDPPLLAERHWERDAGLTATLGVLGPRLGEIEIDPEAPAEGLPMEAVPWEQIDRIHERLAVPDLPDDATVLAVNPGALGPLLDERDIIDSEQTLGAAGLVGHEVDQPTLSLLPIPWRVGDELLDRLVLSGGDSAHRRLHALALPRKKQTERVLESASPPTTLPRGVTVRAAYADLLNVTLESGETGTLLRRGEAVAHALRYEGGPVFRAQLQEKRHGALQSGERETAKVVRVRCDSTGRVPVA
jgi:hypothetical protein